MNDYISLSHSSSLLLHGRQLSSGDEQKTISSDLIGASIDLSLGLGSLPSSSEASSEIGLGISKHLGIGLISKEGKSDPVGIAIHFGLGVGLLNLVGLPVNISGTKPAETRKVSLAPPRFPSDLEFRKPGGSHAPNKPAGPSRSNIVPQTRRPAPSEPKTFNPMSCHPHSSNKD
ncbi:hypothetical protein [Geotalea sp. SG265]|uniref:hypothetical protein n=1 Tax=Geotalea sp. SG265 TaxID=2922867 RepID=UPI001FAFBB52|nr:hypothetical protein [Geotalea sp. SG265]